MKFSQKDLFFSVITGLITGFIAWRIFVFLGRPELLGISVVWLILIVPVLWIIGVNLGYFLGRWMSFFDQFGKFAAIGFTNAAVDFGILNLLIATTGIAAGVTYSVFKSISFLVATLHSYIWNKFWAFETSGSQGGGEFLKFFSVSLLGLLVNVSIASLIVNLIHPILGMDAKVWANVGAVVGSAAALAFSFIGFKFLVFKK